MLRKCDLTLQEETLLFFSSVYYICILILTSQKLLIEVLQPVTETMRLLSINCSSVLKQHVKPIRLLISSAGPVQTSHWGYIRQGLAIHPLIPMLTDAVMTSDFWPLCLSPHGAELTFIRSQYSKLNRVREKMLVSSFISLCYHIKLMVKDIDESINVCGIFPAAIWAILISFSGSLLLYSKSLSLLCW